MVLPSPQLLETTRWEGRAGCWQNMGRRVYRKRAEDRGKRQAAKQRKGRERSEMGKGRGETILKKKIHHHMK